MEFILSLIKGAVFEAVKVVSAYIIKHVITRFKDRTAPTVNRDGSETPHK